MKLLDNVGGAKPYQMAKRPGFKACLKIRFCFHVQLKLFLQSIVPSSRRKSELRARSMWRMSTNDHEMAYSVGGSLREPT